MYWVVMMLSLKSAADTQVDGRALRKMHRLPGMIERSEPAGTHDCSINRSGAEFTAVSSANLQEQTGRDVSQAHPPAET